MLIFFRYRELDIKWTNNASTWKIDLLYILDTHNS